MNCKVFIFTWRVVLAVNYGTFQNIKFILFNYDCVYLCKEEEKCIHFQVNLLQS